VIRESGLTIIVLELELGRPQRWHAKGACATPNKKERKKEKRYINLHFTVLISYLLTYKFWMHQDVKFDFTADLTGIGDRSVRVICDV